MEGGRVRERGREVRGRKTLQLLIIETIYFTSAPQGHHSIYCGKGHSRLHGGRKGEQAGDTGLLYLPPLPGEREGIASASSRDDVAGLVFHLRPVFTFLAVQQQKAWWEEAWGGEREEG